MSLKFEKSDMSGSQPQRVGELACCSGLATRKLASPHSVPVRRASGTGKLAIMWGPGKHNDFAGAEGKKKGIPNTKPKDLYLWGSNDFSNTQFLKFKPKISIVRILFHKYFDLYYFLSSAHICTYRYSQVAICLRRAQYISESHLKFLFWCLGAGARQGVLGFDNLKGGFPVDPTLQKLDIKALAPNVAGPAPSIALLRELQIFHCWVDI